MNEIEEPARSAYELGVDPLAYAESVIVEVVVGNAMVAVARRDDPEACPEWGGPVGPVGLARRIIGCLLEAGWTMP